MITLVKFFATWCGPCSATTPYVNVIRDKYEDVLVTEVDIDSNPQLRIDHHVTQIPTFLIFREGVELARRQGVDSLQQLEDFVNEFRDIQPEVLREQPSGEADSSDTVLHDPSESKDSSEGSN